MKAIQLVEKRRMEVVDVPLPELRPGQVLVRMRAVGICGSDVHYFTHGGLGSQQAALPMSMGHEPAGEIVDVRAHSMWEVGERVAVDPAAPCFRCEQCRLTRYNLCTEGSFMGANAPGAMAEYVAVWERQLLSLGVNESFELGAMLEPMAVASHAVKRSGFQPGMTAAVFGAGPIGLCLALVCRHLGAATLHLEDPLHYRVQRGVEMLGGSPELKDEGTGHADVVFDAAGTQHSLDSCLQAAAPGGTVALVGIPVVDDLHYNPHLCRVKELTVVNVRRSNDRMPNQGSRLRSLPLEKMVTHRFPVERVQEAFETAAEYRDGILKGVMVFGGEK